MQSVVFASVLAMSTEDNHLALHPRGILIQLQDAKAEPQLQMPLRSLTDFFVARQVASDRLSESNSSDSKVVHCSSVVVVTGQTRHCRQCLRDFETV